MLSLRLVVAAFLSGLVFVSGQSRAAEPVVTPPVAIGAPDICGSRWCGTWLSCSTGHNGPLHAHITKIDDMHYHVRFHGRFRTVVPFIYSIDLTVVAQEGDRLILSGCKKVPLYGTFETCVTVTNCDFIATYTTTKGDYGEFKMHRK
jgi:hypothetical protein